MTKKKVIPLTLPPIEDDLLNWITGARSMADALYFQLQMIEQALLRKK